MKQDLYKGLGAPPVNWSALDEWKTLFISLLFHYTHICVLWPISISFLNTFKKMNIPNLKYHTQKNSDKNLLQFTDIEKDVYLEVTVLFSGTIRKVKNCLS